MKLRTRIFQVRMDLRPTVAALLLGIAFACAPPDGSSGRLCEADACAFDCPDVDFAAKSAECERICNALVACGYEHEMTLLGTSECTAACWDEVGSYQGSCCEQAEIDRYRCIEADSCEELMLGLPYSWPWERSIPACGAEEDAAHYQCVTYWEDMGS